MDWRQNENRPGFQRIRTLHLMMGAVLAGYLPLICIFYALSVPDLFIVLLAFTLIVFGIAVAFLIGYTRCPACNQRYHVRGFTGNIFSGRCLHCGVGLKAR